LYANKIDQSKIKRRIRIRKRIKSRSKSKSLAIWDSSITNAGLGYIGRLIRARD